MVESSVSRWVLFTALSSVLCIFGGLMVPVVWLIAPRGGRSNSQILNYGLSMGAGALMCSSLYTMLPRNKERPWDVLGGFLGGVAVSFVLNWIVHRFTAQSMMQCAHELEELHGHEDEAVGESLGTERRHVHDEGVEEQQQLMSMMLSGRRYDTISCVSGVKDITLSTMSSTLLPVSCQSEHKLLDGGHSQAYANSEFRQLNQGNGSMAEVEMDFGKSRGAETPLSRLFSIGIQTCVAVTLHKLPEGFIIFFTNGRDVHDRNMGVSIFLSLAIHNFIEGFTMTLPLYTAFETKWHAVLVTALISGSSQPIGAVAGYLLFRNSKPSNHELDTTFLLSLTSGFLYIISLQMFQAAVVVKDVSLRDDVVEGPKHDHGASSACVKWSCVGIALVLLGSALTR